MSRYFVNSFGVNKAPIDVDSFEAKASNRHIRPLYGYSMQTETVSVVYRTRKQKIYVSEQNYSEEVAC